MLGQGQHWGQGVPPNAQMVGPTVVIAAISPMSGGTVQAPRQ